MNEEKPAYRAARPGGRGGALARLLLSPQLANKAPRTRPLSLRTPEHWARDTIRRTAVSPRHRDPLQARSSQENAADRTPLTGRRANRASRGRGGKPTLHLRPETSVKAARSAVTPGHSWPTGPASVPGSRVRKAGARPQPTPTARNPYCPVIEPSYAQWLPGSREGRDRRCHHPLSGASRPAAQW